MWFSLTLCVTRTYIYVLPIPCAQLLYMHLECIKPNIAKYFKNTLIVILKIHLKENKQIEVNKN